MTTKNDLFRIIDLQTRRKTSHLLNENRKKEEFTDVKLQIGDKLFPAHRIILSLHSPVLKAMISDQWSASMICPISEEYVDPEIVEDLLIFLYAGSIKLTPDNVHTVCMAAHFLQISPLLEPSVKYLCELITVENVLKLFLFSFSCQLDVLRNGCLRFIITNYEKVFQSSEILEFSFENLESLLLGLKEHFWGTALRKHSFDCIVRWTEKYPSKRSEHLPILLKNIPLVELPVEFLEQTVSSHPLVKESVSCAEIISDAITNNDTWWKTKDNFIVIGGYSNYVKRTISKSMFSYQLKTRSWKQLPDISEQKSRFAATVVDGNIIVSGGFTTDFSTTTEKVEMFDWFTQTWMDVPPMPFGLAKHSMAVLNGILYVAGIRVYRTNDEKKEFIRRETRILCYSFESKQWSYVKLPVTPGDCYKLIPYKNHLYALEQHHFEKYDPARNLWTVLAPPKSIYEHFAATLHQDKFYFCVQEDFKVYDPKTNNWTSLPAPPVGWNTSLLSVNDKLLAVGGGLVGDELETDLIYEFNLRTKQWSEFGKLPLKLSFHHFIVGQFH